MWKMENVFTACNTVHAIEGSNYLGLTVTDLVFDNDNEIKITPPYLNS